MSVARLFLEILFFAWELPQNLTGLVLFLTLKARGTVKGLARRDGRLLVRCGLGISLGRYVFWCVDPGSPAFFMHEVNREHEYGHSLQSRMLGPLYLPVVGVPSVCRVLYARTFFRRHGKRWEGYYRGFPEDWADRLGGVDSTTGERLA